MGRRGNDGVRGGSKIRGTVGRDVGQTDNKQKGSMKYTGKIGLNNNNSVLLLIKFTNLYHLIDGLQDLLQ